MNIEIWIGRIVWRSYDAARDENRGGRGFEPRPAHQKIGGGINHLRRRAFRCTRSKARPRVDSSSNLCGEEGFENGDQNASHPAPDQFSESREGPRTSPRKLCPGTRTLSRFR
jgi:hypothetical protein